VIQARQLLRPLACAAGLASTLGTRHQHVPATCAPNEEDHFRSLMAASSLDPAVHYSDLSAMGLATICDVMAYGGGDLQRTPPSTTSLKEIVKHCGTLDAAAWGQHDGTQPQKVLYNSCLQGFTTLVAMCQASHGEALKRVMDSAISTSGLSGVSAADLKERAEWRKYPKPKVKELIDAAEAMYNCEFAAARRCDELTLVNTFTDLMDNTLTVAGLRDKAYGRHHALMSDADRQGHREGYVVLDTTQKKAEETKTWRVAQVLSLINVCLESIVVAAASVTHHPPAGNSYGVVNKGRADETNVPFSLSTKMKVHEAYIGLSGNATPGWLVDHWHNQFLKYVCTDNRGAAEAPGWLVEKALNKEWMKPDMSRLHPSAETTAPAEAAASQASRGSWGDFLAGR